MQKPNLGRDDPVAQVYIVRPELDSVQMIIDQLLLQDPSDIKDAHILFVPRRTIECDELLVEQKHLIEDRIGHAWNIDDRIQHFALDFLMLENDLMSLELPNSQKIATFCECLLIKCLSCKFPRDATRGHSNITCTH